MHQNNPKVIAVLRKFNVDENKFNQTFTKLYKAKFGVDYETAEADYQAKVEKAVRAGQPVPERANDLDVRYKAINTLVADRVGFITAVEAAFKSPNDDPAVLGELRDLTIQENKAVGRHSTRVYHLQGDGRGSQKGFQDVVGQIHFRKTKDGWFISQLGG